MIQPSTEGAEVGKKFITTDSVARQARVFSCGSDFCRFTGPRDRSDGPIGLIGNLLDFPFEGDQIRFCVSLLLLVLDHEIKWMKMICGTAACY